jgi:tRNA1(Val) A37 N6-methylase TrmN6
VSRFAAEALTCDAFLDGRLMLLQPRSGYRAAIDPVLLAAFVPARAGDRVLDLGCGAGTAALCLGARVPGLDLHGLELQPAYADLARQNAAANGMALVVHEGDVAQPPAALRALRFDAVLMNPPFFAATASASPDRGRAAARREGGAALAEWIDAGLRRLVPGGVLALVHRTERLGSILAALEVRAGGVEILPLAARAGRPAGRVLLRARKGSRGSLVLHPPLTLHEGKTHRRDGESYTAEVQAVLRHGSELSVSTRTGSIDR